MIRGHAEGWLAVLFTGADLKDEALGYIKEGWVTIEIEIELFDEREFNKKITDVPKSPAQAPCTWDEPDCDKQIREGTLPTSRLPAQM